MHYVLIDSHQRFLGTMDSDRPFAIGDTFQQNEPQKTYAVIGLNQTQQHHPSRQSLTVIQLAAAKPAADPASVAV